MQTTYSPTSPAAGTSQQYAFALGWPGHAVVINTGPNFVLLPQEGMTVPPNVSGFSHTFRTPVQVANFVIQAPPATLALQGPTAQAQTTVIYTDQDMPESPGALAQPQGVSIQAGRLTVGGGAVQIQVGLARAAIFGFAALDGADTITLSQQINGTEYNLPVINLTQNIASGIAFGHGTSAAAAASLADTFYLGQQILMTPGGTGGHRIDYEVRLVN